MRQYISEGRAIYEDENHGLFSKKLAEWAIGRMKIKDPVTKEKKKLRARTMEDTMAALKAADVVLPDSFAYTAWYLFNMAVADYPKALDDDTKRALYVEETLCDPDGCPEAVLECFEAKMRLAGVPIYWEQML